MTVMQHSAQSGLIAYWLTQKVNNKFIKWLIIALAVILGAMPDIGRLFQSDPSDWNLFYRWSHETWYCYYIPFWNLHIWEDTFLHLPQGGIVWYYPYVEIAFWIGEGFIFYYLILIKLLNKGISKTNGGKIT